MRLAPALLLLGVLSCRIEPDPDTWGLPERHRGRAENARFVNLVEGYLAWHWATNPTAATRAGIHDYDAALPDVTASAIQDQAADLRTWLGRFRGLQRDLLSDDAVQDLEIVDHQVRARLLHLEELRPWERMPQHYREVIAGGLHPLASLAFAPPGRRRDLAASRLARVPAVLEAAKANLKRPAAIHVELAVQEFGGLRAFLADELPKAFAGPADPPAEKRFAEGLAAALASIDSFAAWMKSDLQARADGAYAIGEDLLAKRLQLEEMVDTPIEALIAEGDRLLASTKAEIAKVAASIDATKPVADVLREAAADHPPVDKLLEETRALLENLKRQSREKLCDVPADADCLVAETPSFRRTTSFASMEIPGPFEAVAREAYYRITLPDPSWDAAKSAQHLRFYNRPALTLISVHEAYPGHYTQFLAVRGVVSKVRRVFGCGSFSEGWAHYLEQVYVDELAPGDAKLRLQQLNLALLRICRYLVALRMHARGMTLEQAVEFFERDGGLERVNAEREARRGTVDPTYLVYTLGKQQILALREEVRAAWGAGWSLKEFHNRLIGQGYPPIRIARRLLLGQRE